MMAKQENFWAGVFQRSGQRFVCGMCGFAGEFNSFRQAFSGGGDEVIFFCHSCGNALIFDVKTRDMRAHTGEMIRPEVSVKGKWKWMRSPFLVPAALAAVVVVMALASVAFVRQESRINHLEARLAVPPPAPPSPVQDPGPDGQVDLSFLSAQEISGGYALVPLSVVRESTGVRVRGVVVNEKSIAVDVRFRCTLGGSSQSFFVENVTPGKGKDFEVFLPGATDTAGKAKVEVIETAVRWD